MSTTASHSLNATLPSRSSGMVKVMLGFRINRELLYLKPCTAASDQATGVLRAIFNALRARSDLKVQSRFLQGVPGLPHCSKS